MHKEYRGPAGTLARRGVDHSEALLAHRSEGTLGTLHAERDMCQTTAPAIFVNHLLHGRLGIEWLEQLNQVRTLPNLQQCLAHLIAAEHFFAMNLAESEHPVRPHLAFQFTHRHGNGYMIDEQNSRNRADNSIHNSGAILIGVTDFVYSERHSNSTSNWFTFTAHPSVTRTALTTASCCAVICISTFIDSRIMTTSLG